MSSRTERDEQSARDLLENTPQHLGSVIRTIDQLCLSPLNVRTNREDADATDVMEKSLLAQGQLEPILVHPMRGNKNLWGSHAGGRRYRAFKKLIARGDLPANHPIRVYIREDLTDAQLIEESLAENMIRRDLREYEMCAGIARAFGKGHDVEEIAARLGQPPRSIEQRLRLGQLARPIFDAFAAGQIALEQAEAFGATSDADAQLAAWEALRDATGKVAHDHRSIRRTLKVGDEPLARRLLYVGEDAYLAAGGRLEPDLFADPVQPRHRIVDEPLLQQLAEAKLDALRVDTRRRTGRGDLHFQADPPQTTYGTTDHQLQIHVDRSGDKIAISAGDVVARIVIDAKGAADVEFWWKSRSAKHAGNRPDRDANVGRLKSANVDAGGLAPAAALGQQYEGARQVADAQIREEDGLSADTVQIFRSVRRSILRAMLIDDAIEGGEVAQDYLTWSQLRLAMDMDARPTKIGIAHAIGADRDPEIATEHVRAMPAHEIWRDALDELRQQSFIAGADLVEAFADYHASTQQLKNLATAVVTGFSLERSLAAEGYVVPVHDELARQMGVAPLLHDGMIRRFWTPTEQLLARVPKKRLLEIVEPFVERVTIGQWSQLKVADLARWVTRAVSGVGVAGLREALAAAAGCWVHPLLRFAPPPGAPDNDDAAHAAEQKQWELDVAKLATDQLRKQLLAMEPPAVVVVDGRAWAIGGAGTDGVDNAREYAPIDADGDRFPSWRSLVDSPDVGEISAVYATRAEFDAAIAATKEDA